MDDVRAEHVTWRLEDLYAGPDDPRIEADRQLNRDEAERFSSDFRGKVAGLDAESLVEAVRRFESLNETVHRLSSYAYLYFSTRTQDATASALLQSAQEFNSLFQRDTLFFELEWTGIDEEQARLLCAAPALAPYRHYLEAVRRYRPHLLGESEERLMAELAPVGASSWATLFDKVLAGIRFGKNLRTESEVLADLYHADRSVRKNAAEELTGGLNGSIHIMTHIFNTILLDKGINDRVRRYPHWLRSRNLGNEASDETVQALVEAVTSRYDIVGRYYRLKRKLLGVDELFDYDRYAPLPDLPDRIIPWQEAKKTVLAAFDSFSPDMADIAKLFFDRKWIHAPVLPGKRSGAFAHPTVPSAHPYVMVNYMGRPRDVMTLAHELGHGVHQYLARRQGLFNGDTPLTTAETASVFGEMIVFRHLLDRIENPRERLGLICGKMEDSMATVFRQVAMNRFEDAMHSARRERGELGAETISALWMKTQLAMFGNSVTLLDHYRTWWSYIPHFIHSPGYVYAYAFGELLVLALYRKYATEGASFVPLYMELLSSGGKESPEALLLPLGIDLTDPGFWKQGLTVMEELPALAEQEAERSA